MFDPAATLHDTTSCLRVLAVSILRERHSLDRYRDFATAKLGYCSVLNTPRSLSSSGRRRGFIGKAAKNGFNPKVFLAKVGTGKTISKHHKDQTIFVRGDVADTSSTFKVKIVVMSEREGNGCGSSGARSVR